MSITGSNNLVIDGFDTNFVVWWPETVGLVARIVGISSLEIDAPPVRIVHKDADGNVIPPPSKEPVNWHESFRYFRLSQTTNDLFDAYRNAYLALESILSNIAPQTLNANGRVNEREGAWFKRALIAAHQITDLAPLIPPDAEEAPIDYLFNELYVQMRSAVSHAKSGRPVLLPQNQAERDSILESLQRLLELYKRLAESYLSARSLGGGMFAIAFRRAYAPMLDRMKIVISDDNSPFTQSDTVPNPSGGEVVEATPGPPSESPDPFSVTRMWSVNNSEFGELSRVIRVVGLHNDQPALAELLRGAMDLDSIARLEIMIGVRGSNARQIRTRYSF